MAPKTRSRAVDANTPSQRASAGLIIIEGTSPSPNGLGYPRIPALYNAAHAAAWQEITTGDPHCQPARRCRGGGTGQRRVPGEMYTDAKGMQPHSVPRAMTETDIATSLVSTRTPCNSRSMRASTASDCTAPMAI